MPSKDLTVRRSMSWRLSTDRAQGKQLATIQGGAFLERAQDEARRNLVVAKMSDVGIATHHALEEGDEIVRDVVRRHPKQRVRRPNLCQYSAKRASAPSSTSYAV